MIWVKDWNEDREDHDVDIFNIIQKVQDTGIHLEVCCYFDEGSLQVIDVKDLKFTGIYLFK